MERRTARLERRTARRQPPRTSDPNRTAPASEQQGLGWKNSFGSGSGSGGDAITSGLEGAWTNTPVQWDNHFFDNLHGYEWEQITGPGGAAQWTPRNPPAATSVPDAHDPAKTHAPMMLTTDLALRMDPIYAPIAQRFHDDPDQLADAFAKAWYKLTHRDMGPRSRYLGALVPAEAQLWQDPVPDVEHELISQQHVTELKASIVGSGLSISELVSTAWASASTFRGTDKRGGANGARIRLAPQRTGTPPRPLARRMCCPGWSRSVRVQHRAHRWPAGLAGRPDRAGRLCGHRAGGQKRGAARRGAVQSRAD